MVTYKHSEVLYSQVPIKPTYVPDAFTPNILLRRLSGLRLLCIRGNMKMAIKLMNLTMQQFDDISFSFFDDEGVRIVKRGVTIAALYLVRGMLTSAAEEIEKAVAVVVEYDNVVKAFGWAEDVDEKLMEKNGVLCIQTPFMVIGY